MSIVKERIKLLEDVIYSLKIEYKLEEGKLSKSDLKKPWTINGSQWLIIKGIHEPWAGEISPVQYSRMGRSAKARYDKKRNEEWNASSRGKNEWAKAVHDAHKAGKFDLKDRDVHPDAKSAAIQGKIRSEKEEKDKLFKIAQEKNQIKNTSELKVGDTVYSIMSRGYQKVLKVSKKSVRISSDYNEKGMLQKPLALQWLSYGDLEKKVYGK